MKPLEMGISHILEYMLFKGTHDSTFMDLNKNFDILNCSVNAPSKHLTFVDMKFF